MKPMNEPAIEVIPANPEMVCKENENWHRRTEIRQELVGCQQKQTELIITLNLLNGLKRELETRIASVSSQQEENEARIRQLESVLRGSHDNSNDKDDKALAAGFKKTEDTMSYVRSLMYYDAPDQAKDKNVIVMLPLENGTKIPSDMYAQLITKVPEGKITCW